MDKNSGYIQQYIYHEVRARSHVGRVVLINYLKGSFSLLPAFDPEIQTLKFNTLECPDYQLLIALIFSRYAPDLLKFPFQGKRSIAPETIEYANKINERFPRRLKDKQNVSGGGFYLQPRDKQAEKILNSGYNNPNLPSALLPEACLKAMFESSRTYGLFTAYFDAELYHYAASYYDSHVYGRNRPLYAVIGVTQVLEAVEISQRNHQPYQGMKRFLEQDFATIHDDENKTLDKFKVHFTARIDIKLMKTEGDFQIISVSDDKANLRKPDWFQKGGIGQVITSYLGNVEFIAKSTVNGQIGLWLRGLDVHNPEDKSKRVPYWVDYTKLTVNGKEIFNELTPAWHDKPYRHNINVKAGEEIKIQVEWLPHRSDT